MSWLQRLRRFNRGRWRIRFWIERPVQWWYQARRDRATKETPQ